MWLCAQEEEEQERQRQREVEAERQRLEAEDQWRAIEIQQQAAEMRRKHAAKHIQNWYRKQAAIINAKTKAKLVLLTSLQNRHLHCE